MILYIGSDHVIQQPSIDFRRDTLSVTTDSAVAAEHACKRNAAGIINAYRFDPESALQNDIIIKEDSVAFCSDTALEALKFMGASFVHQ